MNKTCFVGFCFVLLMLGSTRAAADLFEGEFYTQVGKQRYQMTVKRVSGSGYEGIIQVDGIGLMQIDARRFGDRLVGRLNDSSGGQGFIAEMSAGAPVLQLEDGQTLVFRRVTSQ